ncbi:MAG: TonB family protein [Rudaea sp.]|nr:TonB family protein [Rudaea sp.]
MMHESWAILCHGTLTISAAIALVLILRHPARRWFGARSAYLLWAVVPVTTLAILLPAPASPLAIVLPAVFAPVRDAIPAAQHSAAPDFTPWLTVAWLSGVCVLFLTLVSQQRRFVRRLGRLQSTCDGWLAEIADCGPALVGAWRPRVILPADFQSRYSVVERALILAHERTHLARGDAQINVVAVALRCLQWFNPLVYVAASRFRFDQELACDAIVISRFPEARRAYADAIFKTQLAGSGPPLSCHWQSSQPLKERIAMLKQPLPGRTRAALGLGIATALTVAGTYAAWAAQPSSMGKPAIVTHEGSSTDQSQIGGQLISVDIGLRIGDGKRHAMQVRSPDGVPFAVADGEGTQRWEVEGTARTRDDGKLSIDTVIRHNNKIESRPSLMVEEGKSAALEITEPSGLRTFAADFILRRLGADGVQSRDEAASEDLSYRRMYPPEYPKAAIDARLSGKLVLKIQVDEKGNAQFAEVVESDPPQARAAFAQASITAVMRWKYNPASRNGKPASGWALVPIDFSLTDDDS